MECLRRQTPEERGGTLRCDAEGCEYRLFPASRPDGSHMQAPETDCVLQLQLRAGDSEGSVSDDSELQARVDKITARIDEERRVTLNKFIYGEERGKSVDWIRHACNEFERMVIEHQREGN